MKKAIIFLENYTAGGSDKVAKLLAENIPFEKVYFFVNSRNDFSVLESTPFPKNIELIKYNLVTIAELGEFAQKYIKIKPLYLALKIFNVLIRYPLIVFSFFYFYFKFRKLDASVYISNNGGYPGGEYNRSSTVSAVWLKNIKVFHLFHNIPTKSKKIFKLIEDFYDTYLENNSKFIGVASSIIDDMYIKRNFKKEMIRIANGVNSNIQKKYLNNDNKVKFLHIGILDDRKNQSFLIDVAIELIKRDIKDFQFTFMGKEGLDKGYKNNLLDKIKNNNLGNYIDIIDFKKDPFPVYYDADIFLLSSRVESLPIVSLEALSIGLPLITTDTGDTSIQVIENKNGFLIKQDDIKNYTGRVEFFINNKNKIEEFGNNSYKLFQDEFTIEKMVKNYNNIIGDK
jgi:glycosyltransferase involved in cell wall biosynthesis